MTDLVKPLDDIRLPFQIESFGVRGRLVRLGPALDTIISTHGYPDLVGGMLAEAIVLAVLLAGSLKYDGVFTLQTKGNGPISLLVADVTSDGAVRAYAQYDVDALIRESKAIGSVQRLLGAGYLAFTVDPRSRYGALSRHRRAGGRDAGRLRASLFPAVRADRGRVECGSRSSQKCCWRRNRPMAGRRHHAAALAPWIRDRR